MKQIPWFNRPWTKIKRNGVGAMDDAELLALIFIKGNKKHNAVELSNLLLQEVNLHQFHTRSLAELTKLLGDNVKAYQILAVAELCRRINKLQQKAFAPSIESSKDVYHLFAQDFKDRKKEHLYTVLLDAKQRIIAKELISVGSLTQSFAHPREVFRPAIKAAAHSLILVHNHPSGDSSPSDEDLKLTRQLIKSGALLGIKVLDHVIVGHNNYWSHMEGKKTTLSVLSSVSKEQGGKENLL